jgi:hypothetical protein
MTPRAQPDYVQRIREGVSHVMMGLHSLGAAALRAVGRLYHVAFADVVIEPGSAVPSFGIPCTGLVFRPFAVLVVVSPLLVDGKDALSVFEIPLVVVISCVLLLELRIDSLHSGKYSTEIELEGVK